MLDRQSLLVTVGVSVGVAAVGGAIVYALTRDDDSKSNSSSSSSKQTTISLKVDADNAGLVIGRRGENIKEIQRKTNTRINFQDERELILRRDAFCFVASPNANSLPFGLLTL